nr:hypothetical protein BaRGS_006026 [Batillaria attramentaria]
MLALLNYKMGLSGCGNFLKYSMFLFNAVILIAGCGLLGFGVYTKTNDNRLAHVSSILGTSLYSTLSLVLITCGGIVILLSFLGCCGAIKEVRCMLGSFFFLLLMMLIGMLIGGILIYAYREQIGDHVLKELYTSLNTTYGSPQKQHVTDAWDFMQKLFNCCGVYGDVNSTTSWAYYRNTVWFQNQTESSRQYIPESCCRNIIGDNRTLCVGGPGYETLAPAQGPPVYSTTDNGLMYTEGCYSAFITFLEDNVKIVGGVCAGIAVMML